MKKYFVKETDEEIQFGDTIQLDLTKKTKHGVHTVQGEIKFSPMSLPLLVEVGVIEAREVEDEEMLDFDEEPCETLEALMEDFDTLEERVDKLEAQQKKVLGNLDKVMEKMTTLIEVFQETKTTKKKK